MSFGLTRNVDSSSFTPASGPKEFGRGLEKNFERLVPRGGGVVERGLADLELEGSGDTETEPFAYCPY